MFSQAQIIYKLQVASIVLATILIDQISKYFAPSFFSVVCNFGIAFGISFGNTFLYLLILVLVLYLFAIEKKRVNLIFISMILGGGISNFIDRVAKGCVRDFISVFGFPTFNLADALISLGVLSLILVYFKKNNA